MNMPILALLLAFSASDDHALKGNVEAGEAKAATCAACHGVDGNSTNPEWPKLAGQHADYLQRQLQLYKTAGRENAVMAGMVITLNDQDMADLAAYFNAQTRQDGIADESLIDLGAKVYRAGNPETGAAACIACHGPSGAGNPQAGYPALAGQHGLYVANALRAFRDGAVWGKDDEANAVMSEVAAKLSDQEIEAVSSYIQGLH